MAHANQLFLVFCKISTLAEYSLIEQIYENLYMQKNHVNLYKCFYGVLIYVLLVKLVPV